MTMEINPATVPELAIILQTKGMLARVRQLDVVCEKDHRLVQVVRIPKRGPFAFGIDTTRIHLHGSEQHWWWNPKRGKYEISHGGRWLGFWLNNPDEEIVTVNGPQLHNRFTFTCQAKHCSKTITLPWLREKISEGRKRVVVDAKS
jgi:hypothetical protein